MVPLIVELRAEGEHLYGTIITEGRASADRRELFVRGAVQWPSDGIRIKDGHDGPELARAHPHRTEGGELRIRAKATSAIRAAVESGKRYMSVEFRALSETMTDSGIREITAAMVDAAALVADPSYRQTSAEVRDRNRKWVYL